MKPYELTIEKASGLLRKKEISSVDLTRAVLERIEAVDGKVDAFLTVDSEGAMAQAKEADQRLAKGETGPLTGIPLGIKDLMCTKGLRTTCASKILENFIPPYDATVIARSEGGRRRVGGQTQHGRIRHGLHPLSTRPSRLPATPGTRSAFLADQAAESAAAVAADMCLGALGSDTGGSIRQPASHCGVVGIKPTYGRVSPLRAGGLCLVPGPDRPPGQKRHRLRHAA